MLRGRSGRAVGRLGICTYQAERHLLSQAPQRLSPAHYTKQQWALLAGGLLSLQIITQASVLWLLCPLGPPSPL